MPLIRDIIYSNLGSGETSLGERLRPLFRVEERMSLPALFVSVKEAWEKALPNRVSCSALCLLGTSATYQCEVDIMMLSRDF
jgi:hypothetical protein